jgi:hypothetical protein
MEYEFVLEVRIRTHLPNIHGGTAEFEELLTKSVGCVRFPWLIMFVSEYKNQFCWAFNFFR